MGAFRRGGCICLMQGLHFLARQKRLLLLLLLLLLSVLMEDSSRRILNDIFPITLSGKVNHQTRIRATVETTCAIDDAVFSVC